ncbi:MAG: molybdopterin-binding protein [Myxococcota bacterium]|jgi:molybdenum cofactor synthesis domain-containing protein|nr:molybdopterin-binding protein [Myxococcota bacterium]
MPTAGLLIIGNEILSGKIVDTNSPFLASQLRELGVDLERILVIPDIVEIIAEETRRFSANYDYVFTSGGIGPTHDDVTMESIAKAFGQAMRLDEQMCARIERAQKEPLNDAMRKMALMPEGANVIDVSDLWFPVVVVENVHILPGIPQLFEKKFLSIRDRFAGVPIHLTRVFVTRHESDIAEDLNDLLREFSELMLGSYPKIGEPDYRVMLTLESRDSDYLQRATDSLRKRLASEIIFRVE